MNIAIPSILSFLASVYFLMLILDTRGIDPPCGIVGCVSRGIFRHDAAQQICTYCLRLKLLLLSALPVNMNWDNIFVMLLKVM